MSSTTKMNPGWKQKWISALRSGSYQQGNSYLRSTSGKYCCLGVLCDLYDPNGWSPTENPRNEDQCFTYTDRKAETLFNYDDTVLPGSLKAVMKFERTNPQIPLTRDLVERVCIKHPAFLNVGCHMISVAELNDYGFTFNEIADLIEKYF